jgi:hypothetical protein
MFIKLLYFHKVNAKKQGMKGKKTPQKSQKGFARRHFLMVASAGAVGTALHFGLRPDADFDAPQDLTPTHAQIKFMELVAERYYYIGLGDTGHQNVEVKLLGFNRRFIPGYVRANKNKLLIERNPLTDKLYDTRLPPDIFMQACEELLVSNSLRGPNKRKSFCAALGASISTDPSNFRIAGIDTREPRKYTAKPTEFPGLKVKLASVVSNQAKRLSSFLYGRENLNAPITRWITENLPQSPETRDFFAAMSDDTKTAQLILEDGRPAIIFFGTGHLTNLADAYGNGSKSIKAILSQTGKSICVINIFKDSDSKRHHDAHVANYERQYNFKAKPVDANMYALPPAEHPTGIEIINQDLLPLYNQAIQQSAAPSPVVQ